MPPLTPVYPFKWRLMILITAGLLAWAGSLGLRLVELPHWDDFYRVPDGWLMATHDAYFFLAGAQDADSVRPSAYQGHKPFFQFTRFVHNLSGISYGQLGFWLPIFLAPLIILPMAALAWRERLEWALFPLGMMASGCLGFVVRTRLGHYDHDMLNLFLLINVAVALTLVLDRWVAHQWCFKWSECTGAASHTDTAWPYFYPACMAVGALGWVYVAFYPSGIIRLLGLWGVALLLVLFLGGTWRRRVLLAGGLGVAFFMVQSPFWGLLALLAATGLVAGKGQRYLAHSGLFWGLVLAAALLLLYLIEPARFWHQLLRMVQIVSGGVPPETHSGVGLSGEILKESVGELVAHSLDVTIKFMAGFWWILLPALAGYIYLAWQRPAFLVFLPLLGLGLAAARIGIRFVMYASPVLGLGLGLGGALLLRRCFPRARTVNLLVMALAGGLVIWSSWDVIRTYRPQPVLPQFYVNTLIELAPLLPPQARLWLWWDYGYAVQFYTRRATYGDGGYRPWRLLYPMALAHGSPSVRQTAQVMKMVTSNQMAAAGPQAADVLARNTVPWQIYLQDPLYGLNDRSPAELQRYFGDLATTDDAWPADLPPQYLVVTWMNLHQPHWILYYANQNLVTGASSPGTALLVYGNVDIDQENGILQAVELTQPLDTFMVIQEGGTTLYDWPNASGWSAIFNQTAGEFFLMENQVRESMMVRLLLDDPAEFADYFEVVLDRYPWVMVYRLK